MKVDPAELEDSLIAQIGALAAIAQAEGTPLQHVKAHGALYNMAARRAGAGRRHRARDRRVRPVAHHVRPAELADDRRGPGGRPPRRRRRVRRSIVRAGRLADAAQPSRRGHPRSRTRSWSAPCAWSATASSSPPAGARCRCASTRSACTATRRARRSSARRIHEALTAAGADRRADRRLAVKWWREADRDARRALAAGMFGWMLDAFDVMLFALVLPSCSADLGLTNAQGGYLGSVMLVAAAVGGVAFGWFADRFGRTRALMLSVLLYSVFTVRVRLRAHARAVRRLPDASSGSAWAACGPAARRSCRSRGRREHRGKALGFMQSGWAIGYAAAVLVSGFVQPRYGWRAVFFIGILPALFTLWVQRRVKEPAIWTRRVARRDARRPACGRSSRAGIGGADDRPDADEHLHAVRVVGIQPLAAQLSEVESRAGRRGPRHGRHHDVSVHHAGRHVVRLRHVRVRQRSVRPQDEPT